MGFRFRQVFRIFPGLRLNLSKSGLSASVGRPGATVNVGKKGVRGTVGVPGSGLSYSGMIHRAGAAPVPADDATPRAALQHDVAPAAEEAEEAFAIVAHLVAESQTASASWLQRQLRISYDEAAELLSELEERGIVSAPDRVGRRKVLATIDDLPPLPEE